MDLDNLSKDFPSVSSITDLKRSVNVLQSGYKHMIYGSMLPLLQVFRILLYDGPPGLEPVDHRLEPLVRSDVLVL